MRYQFNTYAHYGGGEGGGVLFSRCEKGEVLWCLLPYFSPPFELPVCKQGATWKYLNTTEKQGERTQYD